MKKFNLKTFIILILALVLCFTLVACGEDEDKGGNGGGNEDGGGNQPPSNNIESSEYFDRLWALSSNIGDEKIDAGADKFAVSADLGLTVMKVAGNTVQDSVDIGIALKAVIDQTYADPDDEESTERNTDSAIQAKLYDVSTGENWLTLSFFLSDSKYLYFDFGGQSFKVGFDTGYNDTWAEFVSSFINDKKLFKKEDGGTLKDLFDNITFGMGEGWNLNSLVNRVLKYFNLDLAALINSNATIKNIIEPLIPGVIANGEVDLKALLTSKLISTISQGATKDVKDGQTDYNLTINLSSLSALGGVLDGVMDGLGNLLSTPFTLSFVEKNNEIDNFSITASFNSLMNTQTSVKPVVKIAINDLEFSNVNEDTAEEVLGITKANYSDQFSLDAKVEVDVDGVTVNPSVIDSSLAMLDGAILDGKYTLALNANVDLLNPIETNETKAYAYLAKDGQKIVEVSFTGATKQLGVKINRNVSIPCGTGDDAPQVSIADTVAAIAGGPLYNFLSTKMDPTDVQLVTAAIFDNAALSQGVFKFKEEFGNSVCLTKGYINVIDGFKDLMKTVGDMINGTATSAADEAYPIKAIGVFEIIKYATEYINDEGGLGLNVANVAQAAVRFIKSNGNSLTATDLYARIFAYNQGWVDKFVEFGVLEAGTTVSSLTKTQVDLMWKYATQGSEGYQGANIVGFEEMLDKLLPSFLNNLIALEGADDVITAIGGGSVNALISVSDADGLEVSVGVSAVGGASIDVSVSLDASDYAAEKFITIAPPAGGSTGWIDIDAVADQA